MKKSITIFVLLFVLSVSAFGDGDIPLGGKSCPNSQTNCLATPAPDNKTDDPILDKISSILKFIFG